MYFKYARIFLLLYIWAIMIVALPAPAWAVIVSSRISSDTDDVEEGSNGQIDTNNRQLRIVYKPGAPAGNQTVGLRFRNVAVPTKDPNYTITITKARIEFVVDATQNRNPINLKIVGEYVDNAPAFSTAKNDVSSRNKTGDTGVVWWTPPDWDTRGVIKQTSDLSPIVQMIVDRPGWTINNAMVFIITQTGATGARYATSHDKNAGDAPQLFIEYIIEPKPFISLNKTEIGALTYEGIDANPDTFTIKNIGASGTVLDYSISASTTWLSLSPQSGNLNRGQSRVIDLTYNNASLAPGTYNATITITSGTATNSPVQITVSLIVQDLSVPGWTCGDVPVYIEDVVSPAVLVLLDISGSMNNLMTVHGPNDVKPRTPDIKEIVQEIVNKSLWDSGEDMAFIITGSGNRQVQAVRGDAANAPLLHVEYNDGTNKTLDIRVQDLENDAQENSSGTVDKDNNRLKMGGGETVGMRFQSVPIPRNATITNAYIEFVIAANSSANSQLTIVGELDVSDGDADPFSPVKDNISSRDKTSANQTWNINSSEQWIVPPKLKRVEIGKAVISDLFKDRSVSWGYGTWCGKFNSSIDYTKIHVGTKTHDDTHQQNLQSAVNATAAQGMTPFVPSLIAARKYFRGEKNDLMGDAYSSAACQSTFLINMTDGLGNTGSSIAGVETETNTLSDNNISSVAVGFAIDNAEQINKMAEVANTRGNASATDDLYALHDEQGGVGQPFIATDKDELVEALETVTSQIKNEIFHGAAVAPTTTKEFGNIVVSSSFNPTDWTGELVATQYDSITGALQSTLWSATTAMPTSKNAFTVRGALTNPAPAAGQPKLIEYVTGTLSNDNYICKDLGDIINSTPMIVGNPPFSYKFDDYASFKSGTSREATVYVGANDGALHAFGLNDGVEKWRFYPASVHVTLDQALVDSSFDMCATDTSYCHRYGVDGSPQVGDIYDGSNWKTILVSGLRGGGEAHFALDITSGTMDTTGGSEFLWEFTDPELGLSWTDPSIDRVSNVANNDVDEWAVFFGSGYNRLNQANKEAYLFGIVADDMGELWKDAQGGVTNQVKISTSTLKDDALSSPLAADLDDDRISDRIYVGNLYGSMYRVSDIGKGETPVVTSLFSSGATTHASPVTAKANYGLGEGTVIWVYYGTGRYDTQADKASLTPQYFFGLEDDISATTSYTLGNLASLTVASEKDSGITTYKVINGSNSSKKSWVIALDNSTSGLLGSERVTTKALIVGGLVFFITYTPDPDICSGSGDTWVYAVDFETGLPPEEPVFDINDDHKFDDADKILVSGNLRSVAGIKVGQGLAAKGVVQNAILFVSTTEGGVSATRVNIPGARGRLKSWKESGF